MPARVFRRPEARVPGSPLQIQKYRNRISGPLLDRIDIHVEAPSVRYQDLSAVERGESSEKIRERVVKGRKIQQERFKGSSRIHRNAAMRAKDLQKYCRLEDDAQHLLKMAISDLNFSARAYDRILKVSRTIANLEESETIEPPHVSEAIQYQSLERNNNAAPRRS
jgi:magnesium chelatase family protein